MPRKRTARINPDGNCLDGQSIGGTVPSANTVLGFANGQWNPIAGSTPALNSIGILTLEQFGAKGDNVANDAPALVAAIAALAASVLLGSGYGAIQLGANREYNCPGVKITLPAGCSIFGEGYGTNSLRATFNGDFILFGGDFCSIDAVRLLGSGGAVGGAENLLNTNGFANFSITRCQFVQANHNLTTTLSGGNPHQSGLVFGCTFNGGTGVTNGCEYVRWASCHFRNGSIGMLCPAGNINMTNCVFTDNVLHLHMTDAGNGGHGAITDCQFNHAGAGYQTGIWIDLLGGANSHVVTFVGCVILNTDVSIVGNIGAPPTKSSTGFVGCTLDTANWYYSGALAVFFAANAWMAGNPNTQNYNYLGVQSYVIWGPDNYATFGQTPGGFPSFGNRDTTSAVSYTCDANGYQDQEIYSTVAGVGQIFTLPVAANNPGREITITDISGAAAGSTLLKVAPTGVDTIQGLAANYTLVAPSLAAPLGARSIKLRSRAPAANDWRIVATSEV